MIREKSTMANCRACLSVSTHSFMATSPEVDAIGLRAVAQRGVEKVVSIPRAAAIPSFVQRPKAPAAK
jgi:hypothetical protein